MALVLTLPNNARAQATAPAASGKPTLADLGSNCVIDVPAGWMQMGDAVLHDGFNHRRWAEALGGFHPAGGRPTDVPYLLAEILPTSLNPTADELETEQIAAVAYYRTPLYPPSKTDHPGLWKNASVTVPVVDSRNGRFTFSAKIHYERTGDYRVDVAGIFTKNGLILVNTWSDDAAVAKYGPAIVAMTDSLRSTTGPRPLSLQEQLTYFAKVGGAVLIVLIVGVQAFVFIRERKQRRDEAFTFNDLS